MTMNLKDRWGLLNPRTRQAAILGGVLLGIVVLATTATQLSGPTVRAQPRDTRLDIDVMLPDAADLSMEEFSAKLQALERQLNSSNEQQRHVAASVEKTLSQIRNQADINGAGKRLNEMDAKITAMDAAVNSFDRRVEQMLHEARQDISQEAAKQAQAAFRALPRDMQPSGPARTGAGGPGVAGGAGGDISAPAPSSSRMRVVRAAHTGKMKTRRSSSSTESLDTSEKKVPGAKGAKPGGETSRDRIDREKLPEERDAYLPPGALLDGVLLNGLDAPTSNVGERNPVPVLIRVKTEALLPNFASIDLTECFVIASGFGRLASERAELRLERLSCVRDDMMVLDEKLNGYVIGEDGKVGMRGRLVTRFGSYIASSGMWGFFQGVTQAAASQPWFGGSSSTVSTTTGGAADVSKVLSSGISTGAGKAFEEIAKFYLDLAKETFPVIEIDAGRAVNMVILRGTKLSLR